MSPTPDNEKTSQGDPPSIWRNWISLAGGVLAAASLFAFFFLFALDLIGRGSGNPYVGILCYVAAPSFLILGGAISLAGAWHHRRLLRAGAVVALPRWSIDLSRPKDRRTLVWFSIASMSFLLLTAIGSYQTYVITESNQFCGEVCHSVMGPEFSAYHRTAHAKIACVECHVGSGANSYVKAKVNGTRQLYDILFNKFDRPIATPVHNLRSAAETCEQCHWSLKYTGSLERAKHRYLADEQNTPFTVRLLVDVGGGDPKSGPTGGIHWHMNVNNKVEYIATDAQRQSIPWVRVTDRNGVATVYQTADFKGAPDVAQIRRMDCIDCHNRPAHKFQSPNDAIDEALYLGKVDAKLPGIKRVLVDVMTKPYATQQEGSKAISAALLAKYGTREGVAPTVVAAQAAFDANFFPEMKADWSKHPDNLGHLDSLGCFRCHDSKHLTTDGSKRMPATDCNSCHTIIAQGAGADLATVAPAGLKFKHPSSDIDGIGLSCSDCHNGKNQVN